MSTDLNSMKGRGWRGLQTMEGMMKLRTIFELQARSDNELQVILRQAFNELALSEAHSPQRRNCLGTIENVQLVMRSRFTP